MLLAGRVVDEESLGWEGRVIVKATHGSIFTGEYELLRRECLSVLMMYFIISPINQHSSTGGDGDEKENSMKD